MHIIYQVPIISYNNYCSLLVFGLDKHNFAFLISNQSAAGEIFSLSAALAMLLFFFFCSFTAFPFLYPVKQKLLAILIMALYFPSVWSSSPLTPPLKGDFGLHLPCSDNSLHLSQTHTWENSLSHLQTPAPFSLPPKAHFCSDTPSKFSSS